MKNILLGLTGSIAIYKSVELVRMLVKADYSVRVIMTKCAMEFIKPLLFETISHNKVETSNWSSNTETTMNHIDLCKWADLLVIAPASANIIAKLANGICDDLLSTTSISMGENIYIAPSMNKEMWHSKSNQRNYLQLKQDKLHFIGPDEGEQACGDNGLGRLEKIELLYSEIDNFFKKKTFKNTNILITAGGTFEKIDNVRGISNISSGRMGIAIAIQAKKMGANIKLIYTKKNEGSLNFEYIYAPSAEDILNESKKNIKWADIFICAAAISDFKVKKISNKKIKKSESLTIDLIRNIDVLKEITKLKNKPFCVGFAAEDKENLKKNAASKFVDKKLDLIAANVIDVALDTDSNQLSLFDKNGFKLLPLSDKNNQAFLLLNHISKLFRKKNE